MRSMIAFISLVALGSPASHAGEILPGLWEISSSGMQIDGQSVPAIQQVVDQLANLPAEQRRMVESMLAEQGVALGEKGVRVCLTEQQIKARRLPIELEDGCSHEVTDNSASHWKFRFNCPTSEGEGIARFISDREFTTEVKSAIQSEQGLQNAEMNTHARWVAADCGGISPRR